MLLFNEFWKGEVLSIGKKLIEALWKNGIVASLQTATNDQSTIINVFPFDFDFTYWLSLGRALPLLDDTIPTLWKFKKVTGVG